MNTPTSQPTCQVPWEKIARARDALAQQFTGPDSWRVPPFLFLCGTRFQVSYYQAANAKPSTLEHLGAGHLVDDGLNEACRHALRTLMRIAKSRQMSEEAKGAPNPEWFRLELSFLSLFDEVPQRVKTWLDHGTRETNLARLSFAMGVYSFFGSDSYKFIHAMIKKPFGFSNSEHQPCNAAVKAVLDSFTFDPSWVLPEV